MEQDLLSMERLPTLDEMKEFFRKHDWTTMKIDDPAKRTDEERAEISYVAKLMDEHFEKLAREKGRSSSSVVYGKDNPLIALQENTEDLVASLVTKIANDDELLEGALAPFDFNDPDIHKKVDDFFRNAMNTMLDVMEYDKAAEVIRLNSDESDFNKNISNNFRHIDHTRRWEHTETKQKVILAPDPNALAHGIVPPVDEEAISNVMVEKYLRTLDEKDYKIYILKRIGYTQEEIAKELGFSNNSAVSKRLSDMRKRFHEMTK